MGERDLPAFIDFILETTGFKQLSYVGHSEGTTQMFLGASLQPEYFKEKINLFVALAPVANTAHTTSTFFKAASAHVSLIKFVLIRVLNIRCWIPSSLASYDKALVAACGEKYASQCAQAASFMFSRLGIHDQLDEASRLPLIIAGAPAGSGYRTFLYYAQMTNDQRYSLYDYGRVKNNQIYGQKYAPLVPIENLDIPVALFSGSQDTVGDPEDVAFISAKLGDKVVYQKEYYLNHYSFVLAKDMSWFEDVIDLIGQYNVIE